MAKFSRNAGGLLGVLLVALIAAWLWGARAQAIDRRCIAVQASEREAFGFPDWIATGWDWPIHWINGTTAQPIPCKPGVNGLGRIPADSIVGNVLQKKDGEVAPGELGGSLPVGDSSSAPLGHRNLDRFLVDHSGDRASAPAQPAADSGDQGLTPEARVLLEKRLKEER